MRIIHVVLVGSLLGCGSSSTPADGSVDVACTVGTALPCTGCAQGGGTITCLPPGIYSQCECAPFDAGAGVDGGRGSDAVVDVNVPGTDVGWDVGETCAPGATCDCGGGTTATLVCTGPAVGYCACEAEGADGGTSDAPVTDIPAGG